MTTRWNPEHDAGWERIPTPGGPSVQRYRRTAPWNGLHPEVCKARGSRVGTWYSGTAYDPATGLCHHMQTQPASTWRWPQALDAALAALTTTHQTRTPEQIAARRLHKARRSS